MKLESEKQFSFLMEEIDREFKNLNVPIPARPISAIREVAKRYKTSLQIAGAGEPITGVYEGKSLTAHIFKWFNDRYGDRLKIDFSLGYVVVLINEDPYKMKIPLLYGKGRFILDKTLKEYPGMVIQRDKEKIERVIVNVYRLIKGVTPKSIGMLNHEDEIKIMEFFVNCFTAISRLHAYKDLPYQKEARLDLANAVDIIMNDYTTYGQSKWATLQLVEKIMKGLLLINGINFKKVHDLDYLSKQIDENKICSVSSEFVDCIKCDASTRYGETIVTRDEAIRAHHSSIFLLNELLHMRFDHFKGK